MKILLLSYAFPPMATAEAYVAAKSMKALKGIDVDVISLEITGTGISADKSLDTYIDSYYNVLTRIELPAWAKWGQRNYPFIMGICSRFPDAYVYANRNLSKYLQRIDFNKYDAIISRSQWHSIHLVALEIKRQHPNIPWVAHFSDPWSDNVLASHGSIINGLNRSWERAVVEAADRITVTSPETKELMFAKYPDTWRKKAVYIPHCYDEELYDVGQTLDSTKYVIRSLGSFYGRRSPRPFFAAVNQLFEKESHLFDNVQIEFIGLQGRHKASLQKYIHAAKLIKIGENVSYRESLKKMQQANCLLSIEAPMNDSVFFPSKLVDYMGAGRYIFSLSSKGAAWNILNSVGGKVVCPDAHEDIVTALREILIIRPSSLENSTEIYSQTSVASKWQELLESL